MLVRALPSCVHPLILVFALALAACATRAASVVIPYAAFGPRAMSYETLGFEWWQWQPHGDSRPRGYDVRVVVYCNTSVEEIARDYPVDQASQKDYRYIDYRQALTYLDNNIAENADPALTEELRTTRKKLVEALPSCH